MNIITGYRGEPHITSSQDRAKNQGMYGTGSYIMNVGQKLQAQVVSANEIRIRDGVLSHQGCIAVIENGAYDSLEISNGTQGTQRSDLIVARYTKDAETNVENITLVVIEGTPAASNPSDPAYNEGDIQAGDSPVDFPLYRVNISGVTISGTTRLASYVQTQAEADLAISTLNSNKIKKLSQTYANINVSTSWNGLYYGDIELPASIRNKNIVSVMPHYFTSGVAIQLYINTVDVPGMTTPTLRLLSTVERTGLNLGVDYFYYD